MPIGVVIGAAAAVLDFVVQPQSMDDLSDLLLRESIKQLHLLHLSICVNIHCPTTTSRPMCLEVCLGHLIVLLADLLLYLDNLLVFLTISSLNIRFRFHRIGILCCSLLSHLDFFFQ